MPESRNIRNWGNFPSIEARVYEPQDAQQAGEQVRQEKTILPRGNGRSYGDAALHEILLSTLRLDKILHFDPEQGILRCQAGVLLAEILKVIVPKGYLLPVLPGTQYITLGGAIAANVHGKNHRHEACLSNHVLSMIVLDDNGEAQYCSPKENQELFYQTLGGMGLTGSK